MFKTAYLGTELAMLTVGCIGAWIGTWLSYVNHEPVGGMFVTGLALAYVLVGLLMDWGRRIVE